MVNNTTVVILLTATLIVTGALSGCIDHTQDVINNVDTPQTVPIIRTIADRVIASTNPLGGVVYPVIDAIAPHYLSDAVSNSIDNFDASTINPVAHVVYPGISIPDPFAYLRSGTVEDAIIDRNKTFDRVTLARTISDRLSSTIDTFKASDITQPWAGRAETDTVGQVWLETFDGRIITTTNIVDQMINASGGVCDQPYEIYTARGSDVHVCIHYACDMAERLESINCCAGVTVLWRKYDDASHAQTWVILDGVRYIIEPQTGEWWVESAHGAKYDERFKVCFLSVSKGREYAKSATELFHR